MKHFVSAGAALLLSTSLVSAAGLDRSGQSVNAIFAEDDTVSLSFGVVQPNVVGKDDRGNSYEVGDTYTQLGFSYTQVINEQISIALIFDQPYGANVDYNNDPSTSNLGGTGADLSSESLGLVGKYQFNENFSVFGGVKAERIRATVNLNGLSYSPNFAVPAATQGFNAGLAANPVTAGLPAIDEETFAGVLQQDPEALAAFAALYGPFAPAVAPGVETAFNGATSAFFDAGGYEFEMEDSVQPVFLIGAAYEIPDIALRFAVTYHFENEHSADTTEEVFGQMIDGEVDYVTPQSLNLDFQTGVAEDTLLTASYRWTEFSAVDVVPDFLGADLVNLDDGERYTIGVARRFSESFAGSATFLYEPEGDDLVSPLGPTNGLMGITIGGQYEKDNVTLAGGLNYSVLGDATPEVGGVGQAEFEGSSSFGIGFRAEFTF